jgi:hypothetical protein
MESLTDRTTTATTPQKSDPRRVGRGIQELIFHVNANLQSEEQVSDATVQASIGFRRGPFLCAVAGKMGICPSQRPKGCPTQQHKPILVVFLLLSVLKLKRLLQ